MGAPERSCVWACTPFWVNDPGVWAGRPNSPSHGILSCRVPPSPGLPMNTARLGPCPSHWTVGVTQEVLII